jgi:hypothetical protein
MRNKILVVGTVRNCSKSIRRVVRSLERELLAAGREPQFFLVESDSEDNTLDKLNALSKSKANFRFTSLGNLRTSIPDRLQRIAACRNVYLQELERLNAEEFQFSHLVVADFDEVNFRIRIPRNGDWLFSDESVFTSNQLGRYYDILALRASGWVEEDYRISIKRLQAGGSSLLRAYLKAVSQKQLKIPHSSRAFEVQSAFGGLAVYPAKVLVSLRYVPELIGEGLYECEHVSLSKSIRNRGTKIQIAPGLRNSGSFRHAFASNPFVLMILWTLTRVRFRSTRL